MSGGQPPPRINIFLPLILKRRLKRSGDCSATSDVISRMPNFVCDSSETAPSVSNDKFSSYKFGVPICARHHNRGLRRLSCGYPEGEKTMSFDSPAASSTDFENSMLSILP